MKVIRCGSSTNVKQVCITVGCIHWPYLVVSHAHMWSPWQPCMPLPLQPHTPPQPCMPPATMHTPPPQPPHMPPTTMHAPLCNHGCPPSNHACPQQPRTSHSNHTCPLATMHAPLATMHAPPCGQNHRCLCKYNPAPTSSRAVIKGISCFGILLRVKLVFVSGFLPQPYLVQNHRLFHQSHLVEFPLPNVFCDRTETSFGQIFSHRLSIGGFFYSAEYLLFLIWNRIPEALL